MKVTGLFVLMLVASIGHAAPPPGHPTPDQAAQMMGGDRDDQIAFQAEVVKAVDSNAYTFIQVRLPDGELRWLAAPRLVLQPGLLISYPEGVLMRNFYSKKLKHQFASIWFVSWVEVQPNR